MPELPLPPKSASIPRYFAALPPKFAAEPAAALPVPSSARYGPTIGTIIPRFPTVPLPVPSSPARVPAEELPLPNSALPDPAAELPGARSAISAFAVPPAKVAIATVAAQHQYNFPRIWVSFRAADPVHTGITARVGFGEKCSIDELSCAVEITVRVYVDVCPNSESNQEFIDCQELTTNANWLPEQDGFCDSAHGVWEVLIKTLQLCGAKAGGRKAVVRRSVGGVPGSSRHPRVSAGIGERDCRFHEESRRPGAVIPASSGLARNGRITLEP